MLQNGEHIRRELNIYFPGKIHLKFSSKSKKYKLLNNIKTSKVLNIGHFYPLCLLIPPKCKSSRVIPRLAQAMLAKLASSLSPIFSDSHFKDPTHAHFKSPSTYQSSKLCFKACSLYLHFPD